MIRVKEPAEIIDGVIISGKDSEDRFMVLSLVPQLGRVVLSVPRRFLSNSSPEMRENVKVRLREMITEHAEK